MTQIEQKIEQFQSMVGFEASGRFEEQIAAAVLDLAEALQTNFLDNEMKINYATHVFAKMLDDLAEMLERPKLWN